MAIRGMAAAAAAGWFVLQCGTVLAQAAKPAPAPTQAAAPAPIQRAAKPATAPAPTPAGVTRPEPECEIKPVMSDEDLRRCGATPR